MIVTRRITFIAVIMAIVLVAVGIGYAYTASTQNSGNAVNSEYVKLVQGGEGAYTFAVESEKIRVVWNTLDKRIGETFVTEFTLADSVPGAVADHMGGYRIIQLGNSFKLMTEGIVEDPYSKLQCGVSSSGTLKEFDNFKATFFLKIENGNSTTWFKFAKVHWNPSFEKYNEITGEWDGGSIFDISYDSFNNRYHDTSVTVYYATDGDKISVEHSLDEPPAGPSDSPLIGASLIFKVIVSN